MNTRQAKKLLRRQWHRCPTYWFDREIEYFRGTFLDHRIAKAMQLMNKYDKRHGTKIDT